MAIKKHTHKLKRHEYSNGEKVYFCTLDCDYKVKVALALGKKSICNRCGDEFILNEYSLRLAKPICSKCKKTKTDINLDEVMHDALTDKILPDYPARPTHHMPKDTEDLLSRLRKVQGISESEATELDPDDNKDML